ncbi:hypothetical protein DFH27DRAFT_103587 [Peziza echinospora]|nr:hypothetical protein DFH27DRAFT_103587 [Peziza echinospora]
MGFFVMGATYHLMLHAPISAIRCPLADVPISLTPTNHQWNSYVRGALHKFDDVMCCLPPNPLFIFSCISKGFLSGAAHAQLQLRLKVRTKVPPGCTCCHFPTFFFVVCLRLCLQTVLTADLCGGGRRRVTGTCIGTGMA